MVHRRLAISFALAACIVGAVLSVSVAPARVAIVDAASTSASPTARRTAVPLACVVIPLRRVDPTMVLLGETVDVTMTVTALCAGLSSPLHIVLVIDGSAAMAGALGRDVRSAAADLIDQFNLRDNPGTRVAVVGFGDRVRVRCALSNERVRVTNCVDRIGASGAARLEGGLAEAKRMLHQGRTEFPPPYVIREHVIVYAARPAGGCARSLREAGRLKADGAHIETVCAGQDCDAACLRSLATSSSLHFAFREQADLLGVFAWLRGGPYHPIRLEQLTIIDQLPEGLELLTDTVQPSAWQADAATGRIGWTLIEVPREGMTVTYRVRTLRPGGQPTTLGASGRWTNTLGQVGTFDFNRPLITVLGTTPGEVH